jgi:hypothetical protein
MRVRRTVDQLFFETPDVQNSYWAGFLAADGNLRNTYRTTEGMRVGARIALALKTGDGDHLQRFVDAVKYSGPTQRKTTGGFGGFPISRVDIYGSEKLISDLGTQFNVPVGAKGDVINPPELTAENALAYAVGYIDGDGSVVPWPDGRIRAIQWFGNRTIVEWIKAILERYAPPLRGKTTKITPLANGFLHRIEGVRAAAIVQIIVSTSIPFMERKWTPLLRRAA